MKQARSTGRGVWVSFEDREERAETESERKRIPDLGSRKTKGTTTVLFSFEEGDVKGSVIRRRVQRPRRDVDLDKFSQVLRGSASDDLIAEAGYFVFNSLYFIIIISTRVFRRLFALGHHLEESLPQYQ